jgi:ABC-2 type transport system ATP-binding protein
MAVSPNIHSELVQSGWSYEIIQDYLSDNKLSSQMPFALRINNVSKQFGSKKILNNVSLDIGSGEIFGIIGLSGTGKTTLLNIMIGFMSPDEGDVLLQSDAKKYSVFNQKHIAQKMFGFSAQDASFYQELTVEENLHHFASLYGLQRKVRKSRARKMANLIGLEESLHKLSKNLSGGMQKRLDIGCALMHNPEVLILDEPTSNLDPIIRKQIWGLIRDINKTGTTIIIASHFLDEIEHISHRIGILRHHRLLEVGTPNELRSIYSKNYEIRLQTISGNYKKIVAKLRKNKNMRKIERQGTSVVIHTPHPAQALDDILHVVMHANESIQNVTVSKPSVKELFESLAK